MDTKHLAREAKKKEADPKILIKIKGITYKRKKTAAEAKAKYDAKSFSKLRKLKEDHYKIVRDLGDGFYGTTYLASDDKSNQLVVIKQIHGDHWEGASKSANLAKFKSELSILHRLKRLCRTQLVPCYIGYFWKPEPEAKDPKHGSWCFVTNYLGDDVILLEDYLNWIDDEDETSSKEERWRRFKIITANLINGMKKFHDLDITHSDPHTGNILIHRNTMKITFIDFGEACYKGFCLETDAGRSADYDERRSWADWRQITMTIIHLIERLKLQDVDLRVINEYLHSFDLEDIQLSVISKRGETNWSVLRIHA